MPARSQSSASAQGAERRQSAMERRAAQVAALSAQQSNLKREAAERQVRRDKKAKSKAPSAAPRQAGRRSNAR